MCDGKTVDVSLDPNAELIEIQLIYNVNTSEKVAGLKNNKGNRCANKNVLWCFSP